jgi:hypothetical protein
MITVSQAKTPHSFAARLLAAALFAVAAGATALGQTTLYSENFGAAAALPAGWASSNAANGWEPSTSSPSPTPSFSGGANVLFNNTGAGSGPHTLTYGGGLSTVGHAGVTVLWAGRATASFNGTINFQWSADGVSWNAVTFTNVAHNAAWAPVNGGARIPLPAAAAGQQNLRFRFVGTPPAASANGNYRLDDFSVQATPITLSVGDVTVAEPAAGQSYARFAVTLSHPARAVVTASFSTADGSATAPGDYAPLSGTITFAPGETSKTVAVAVKADAVSEAAETFGLQLSGPAGAGLADPTGVATITEPVPAGSALISEFRLRGPGATSGPQSAGGHALIVPLTDAGFDHEGEEGPVRPTASLSVAAGGAASASPATAAEADEFVEVYNNTDADIIVADSNPVTCLTQILTAGPATLCGWALVDLQGAVSNIPRFVIPAGTVIPARGRYLAAGIGYSLSATAAPDQTYDPPAYAGGEADDTGLALFRTADRSQFTPANVVDAVGFDGAALPFREGPGLKPPGGVAADAQHSFVRRQASSRPADTGNNAADFVLVATDPALVGNAQAVLGAPGPERVGDPVQRNSGFAVSTPPGVEASVRRASPAVPNGNLGTLSLRRRFTNNTGQAVTKLRFRVTEVSTLNSWQVFPNQAEVRLLDATLEGLGGTGLLPTTLEAPSQPNGGGVNTGLLVNNSLTLARPLQAGQSLDVEFLLGVMRGGSYQFIITVEAAP